MGSSAKLLLQHMAGETCLRTLILKNIFYIKRKKVTKDLIILPLKT